MEKIKQTADKLIQLLPRADQNKIKVHDIITDGIKETRTYIGSLKDKASLLSMTNDEAWTKGHNIITDTTTCLNLLLKIYRGTKDSPVIRFRHCRDIFPLTFDIANDVCKIVCDLCGQIAQSFSIRHHEKVKDIGHIPELLDSLMSFFTPQTSTDLSNDATIEGVQTTDIQACRKDLHVYCITFCECVAKQINPVLKAMKRNNARSSDDFKPFLVCMVQQHYYIQRACGLAREVIKCMPEGERNSEKAKYRLMFRRTRVLFKQSVSIVRSMSSSNEVPVDFKPDISSVCDLIKECKQLMRDYIKSDQKDLNSILKSIELACHRICQCVDPKRKCLPPGQEKVEEDVTLLTGSDFEEVTDSDFEEVSDSDFDMDFDLSMTKVSPEECSEDIKDSDFEPTEVIRTYKMDGFRSASTVCVDNIDKFSWSSVGGKVRKDGKWKSAQNVKVEENKVTMDIEPGDFFVVHYNFPSGEHKFSKDDLSKGSSMSIPEAKCSFRLPPISTTKGLTAKYKVHMTDKDRIKGYQDENPEEFNKYTISEGIQVTTTAPVENSLIEFPEKREGDNTYVIISSESGKSNWSTQLMEPTAKENVAFTMKGNSITHLVKIDGRPPPADQSNSSFLGTILDGFLTLLGLQSKCKLLTLFKIPEDDPDVIELRVECIESQQFHLNKKSNSLVKRGWQQIQQCDESADFMIKSGGKVNLEFRENVKPSKMMSSLTPIITFQKRSTCFFKTELELEDSSKKPVGYLMCYVNKTNVDWKRLNWKHLLKMNKDADKSKQDITNDKRKELQEKQQNEKRKIESNAVKEVEHTVKGICVRLSEEEKQALKKELNMTFQKTEDTFIERMTTRVKEQGNRFKYINNLLMKIGRIDLLQELLEKAEL
ncbi:uncharacterized protein LOC125665479 [Ostrea edulis]|uniref:uncharacterized protein LOC125665479 n=1 Tax=Ostrea edulis TaxID=37623 RepID=UPI0024AEAE5F|nr:uncharacterized protein LOC125665479 [Ostrea edulis]